MADKPVLRVTVETRDALKAIAEEKDQSLAEAAETVIAAGLMAMSVGAAQPSGGESILDAETAQKIADFANANNMTQTEAARRLVTVAIGRLQALGKYAVKTAKNGAQ